MFILIMFSFFFSGYESAILSLRLSKIRELARKKIKNAHLLLNFKKDQHNILITLLIGNNLVNVAASALATKMVFNYTLKYGFLEAYSLAIATGIMTFLLLMFGEITPKTLGVKRPEQFALLGAKLVLFFKYVFFPVRWFFEKIANTLLKIFGMSLKDSHYYGAGEIREFVEISHEEGAIKETEKEFIHNVLDFNDISVKEIMTPISKVVAIESEKTIKDLITLLVNDNFSRIPVYNKHIEDIIGVIFIKDILPFIEKGELNIKVKDVRRKILHVPSSKKISSLFNYFKNKKEHIAVVVNEFGNTLGIVTLEDILEELVGEIQDESDEEEDSDLKKISDNIVVAAGTVSIEEINELLNINIPENEQYQTVAGYIFYLTGKIPKKGYVVNTSELIMTIIDSDHKKINKVRIEKKNSFKDEIIGSADNFFKKV